MKKIIKLAGFLRHADDTDSDTSRYSFFPGIWFSLLLTVLGCILLGIFGWYYPMFESFLGDPSSMCLVFYLAGAVMGAFLLVPQLLNYLYLADDFSVLLTLPISVPHILAAKMLNCADLLILITTVTTLPFGITSGISCHKGASYFLAAVLAGICIPLTVICLLTSILMIIMYFVKGLRRRDSLKAIGAAAAFVITAVIAVLSNNSHNKELLAGIMNALKKCSFILPVSFPLNQLLKGQIAVGLIGTLTVTAVCIAVFLILASRIYLSAALSMKEGSSSAHALTEDRLKKGSASASVLKACLIRELRTVKRDPAFLNNGFLLPLFYPAVILFVTVFSSQTSELFGVESILDGSAAVGWCMCITMMITFCSASTSAISTTAFSREGSETGYLCQFPIRPLTVIRSKFYAAFTVSAAGTGAYVVIGGLILTVMGKIPFWCVLYSLLLSLALLYFVLSLNILRDVRHPVLTWESKTKLIRKCTRISCIIILMIGILLPMILLVGFMIIPELILPAAGGVLAAAILAGYLMNRHLYRVGVRKLVQ